MVMCAMQFLTASYNEFWLFTS